MSDNFLDYIDPSIPIEERLQQAFNDLQLCGDQQEGVTDFLRILKCKSPDTYEHSIRVGLLARRIAEFMHCDERSLLYAGLLHDIGKAQTPLETLHKTEGWTDADSEEIKQHVLDSYRLARDHFDFSAEIIAWHHRFQKDGYPEVMPQPLHDYCAGTMVTIAFYGRILALADCFDALHRDNSKFGVLTGEQIREKMMEYNPDQRILIEELYGSDIFTERIIT